jgi:trans-2,3-dihydro-3-hydroxyanthranilate isomerase
VGSAATEGGLPLTWLDVFTAERLTGNQLAVVHDADGVDDATMIAFARETRLSETTFVQTATEDGADYRNRICMMSGELDFAGHPSLGTAVAVALARGEQRASYVQQTPSGLQPLDVEVRGDGVAHASMVQNEATFGTEIPRAEVGAAVRLTSDDLHPDLPPQLVSTGQAHIMAPVMPGALGRVAANPTALKPLLDAYGATVVYLAEIDPEAQVARARSFFMDPDGATEDPATGSAAGPLLAYLHQREGLDRLTIDQAVEMGRPSRLECTLDDGRVRVAGDCVVVATGTVRLDR